MSSYQLNQLRLPIDFKILGVLIPLIVIIMMLTSQSAMACKLPVYRYALEKWEASPYTLIVFGEGDISEEKQALLKLVNAYAFDKEKALNIEVFYQDINKIEEEWLKHVYAQIKTGNNAVLIFPDVQGYPTPDDIAWQGEATKDKLNSLFFSKSRTQIAQLLAAGNSGVVLWLPSKEDANNTSKYEELNRILEQVSKNTDLVDLPQEDIDLYIKDRPPLMAKYPIITLNREDIEEAGTFELLKAMTSKEAFEKSHAYFVFGRGRILTALNEEQLELETCTEISDFLQGECSCKVKADNPGIDFLIAANWMDYQQAGYVNDTPLPTMTGTGKDIAELAADKPVSPEVEIAHSVQSSQAPASSNTLTLTVIGSALLLLVLGIASLFFIRKSQA